MLLAKLIKLLCPLVFIHAKIKTSNDWGYFGEISPLKALLHDQILGSNYWIQLSAYDTRSNSLIQDLDPRIGQN